MTDGDRWDEYRDWVEPDGVKVLDALKDWFGRFIAVTDPYDLYILALWTAHTFLVEVLYTTPRLRIDSTVFGSGKTTVLDHLEHLCRDPMQAASLSSAALIPRVLEHKMRTILLDEVDRSLRPDKPGVEDMIAILNSGYRFGATRPVLVPVKGGGWEAKDMSTHAPVVMAGNSPHLPADTVSRELRILLMPDLDGVIEESDWEEITTEAASLKADVAAWADEVREGMAGMKVELPEGCIGRSKEKWRPLKRVAVAAGGDWPSVTDELIRRNIAEDAAEREAGLKTQPPGMVMLTDLHTVWPWHTDFMSTRDLVGKLILHNPDYWGVGSAYGKPLTDTRLGRLVSQAAKVTSSRPGGVGPRGYVRAQLEPVWHRLGIGRFEPGGPQFQPGEPGYRGEPGGEPTGSTGFAKSTGLNETPTEPGAPPIEFIINRIRECGGENLELPVREIIAAGAAVGYTERQLTDARSKPDSGVGSRKADRRDDPGAYGGWMWYLTFNPDDNYRSGLCRDCGTKPHSAGRPRCNECHTIHANVMAGYDR